MKVKSLIDVLKMLPDEAQVYITTNPDDMSTSIERRHIKVFEIYDMRAGEKILSGVGVKLTAFPD